MKRTIFCFLLLCAVLLCACGEEAKNKPIHPGETYLNGGYYNDELRVGYSFFPDGTGFQFIGSTVNPIRYGIIDGKLFVSVNDAPADSFSFAQSEDALDIGGIPFRFLKDDPEAGKSVEQMLSGLAASDGTLSGEEESSSLPLFLFLPVLAIVAFVLFLALWVRKKSRFGTK